MVYNNLPQVSIKIKDYGDVIHSTILTILGDELTYNELKDYAENGNDYSNLKVKYETYNYDDYRQHVTVWIDEKIVLEKKTKAYISCDMNYYLQELEDGSNSDDEEKR